jgi:hypothetical protein
MLNKHRKKYHKRSDTVIFYSGTASRRITSNGKYPGYYAKGRFWLLHISVAQCFIRNPKNKPLVNHKDGNKKNPHGDNLEWATHSENSQHAWDNGLNKHVPKSNLTRRQILYIRRTKTKLSLIAKRYGVSYNIIYNIHYLKTFRNV